MKAIERIEWTAGRNEAAVEKFYEAGIGADLDWHGGYRNFGLWEADNRDYLRAADALVLQMNRLLGLTSSSHLLDVGCGSAPQDLLLHRETGATIDAVDATWAQVKRGRERIAEAGLNGSIRIHHGTATDLSMFATESFTHVLSIEAAQHFDTREAFFREAFQKMQPGGVIALADFIVRVPAARPWERVIVRRAQRSWNVPDANVLDRAGYQATLERSGFAKVTFEDIGAQVLPGYYKDQNTPETVQAHKRYKGRMWRFRMNFSNYFVFKAWEKGLMEYSLVRAVKP
jgi:2-polyprenyl-3-methyl-5-hydroxy-6-metoxy-1,4-benzoquinol methylase